MLSVSVKHFFVSILVLLLCSCSLLGSRQESTKKDLDVGGISQMKIVHDDSSSSEEENENVPDTPEQQSNEPSPTDEQGSTYAPAIYEAKYIDPVLYARDYIFQNQIKFDGIDDDKAFKDMDRAALFFGLGAEIYSELNVSDLTEETKPLIPAYDIDKVQKIQESMHCTTPAESFVIWGSAPIVLDNTEIGPLMSKEDKEDYLDLDVDPAKEKILFSDLDHDVKEIFVQSFVPQLDTLRIGVAHHVMYCPQNDQQKPIAYFSNYKDYYPIDADRISSANADHVTLQFERVVGKEELTQIPLNNKDIPTLDQLAYVTSKKKIKVFHENDYKKIVTLSFESRASTASIAHTSEMQPTKEEPAPSREVAVDMKMLPTGMTAIMLPPEFESAPLKELPVSKINIQNLIAVEEARLKSEKQPEKTQAKSNSESPKSIPPTSASHEQKTPSIPAIVTTYSPKANVPVWFDPRMTYHARNFYQIEYGYIDNEYVDTNTIKYMPGDANWSIWDDSAFTSNYLSDTDVKNQCANYTYTRNMEFNVNISRGNEKTITIERQHKNRNQKYTLTRTYDEILFDQFRIDSELDIVGQALVDSTRKINPELSQQTWRITTCFDPQKEFKAFWSSKDTANIYAYNETANAILLSETRKSHWLPITTKKDKLMPNKTFPKDFNPSRQKHPHSLFTITCKDEKSMDCAVEFQFAIKRDLDGPTSINYLDSAPLKILKIAKLNVFKKIINKSIYEDVDHPEKGKKVNRNEVFIFGGFKFNPNETGTKNVSYETMQQLKAQNYISKGVPEDAGYMLMPGETSSLYFEVAVTHVTPPSNMTASK